MPHLKKTTKKQYAKAITTNICADRVKDRFKGMIQASTIPLAPIDELVRQLVRMFPKAKNKM